MITIEETRDYELVACLNEQVQNLHHYLHPAIFKAFNQEAAANAIKQFFSDPGCKAYLAMKENEVAGYVIVFIREAKENPFHYTIRSVYIDQICVLEQYRGMGIGKLLIQRAEELAKESGINTVELDHWSSNQLAAKRFRQAGYTLVKERLSKLIGQ